MQLLIKLQVVHPLPLTAHPRQLIFNVPDSTGDFSTHTLQRAFGRLPNVDQPDSPVCDLHTLADGKFYRLTAFIIRQLRPKIGESGRPVNTTRKRFGGMFLEIQRVQVKRDPKLSQAFLDNVKLPVSMAQGKVVDICVFGGVSGEFDSAHEGRFCGVTTAPWRDDVLSEDGRESRRSVID